MQAVSVLTEPVPEPARATGSYSYALVWVRRPELLARTDEHGLFVW